MNPVSHTQLAALARQFGTPLWVYDAATLDRRVASLRPFDVLRFAQKANSNTHLLRHLRAQGVAVDAVSLGEIERALDDGVVVNHQDLAGFCFGGCWTHIGNCT